MIGRLKEMARDIKFFCNRPLSENSQEDNYLYMCLFNRWLMECYYISVVPDNDEVGYTWDIRDNYRNVVIRSSNCYEVSYDRAFEEGLKSATRYVEKLIK